MVYDSAGVEVIVLEDEAPSVTVMKDFDIGNAGSSDSVSIGRPTDVSVTDEGLIVLLDQAARYLLVFDSAGKLVRTIGRPGEGPGELGPLLTDLLVLRRKQLAVPDVANARLTYFSTDGSFDHDVPIRPEKGLLTQWATDTSGRILVQSQLLPFSASGQPTEHVDDLSAVINFLGGDGTLTPVLEMPRGVTIRPGQRVKRYAPEPVWSITHSGELVVSDGATARLQFHELGKGRVIRAIELRRPRREITGSEKRFLLERTVEAARASGVPEQMLGAFRTQVEISDYYPAFTDVLTDDADRIWAQLPATADYLRDSKATPTMQNGSAEWDVFSASGHYLGTARFPSEFTLTAVRGAHCYGYGISNDLNPVLSRFTCGIPEGVTQHGA